MSNVVNLAKDEPVRGKDAVAEIVAFLRKHADAIESGNARPVHKLILVAFEDRNEQFRVSTAYCNATAIERAGMLSMSLHDTTDVD